MLYAYGYTDPDTYRDVPELQKLFVQNNELETMLDYCYQHADRPNPVQDLIDKGLVNASYQGTECRNIKSMQDDLAAKGNLMLHNFWATHDSDGNKLPECDDPIGFERCS
jgi:hypothetical protein